MDDWLNISSFQVPIAVHSLHSLYRFKSKATQHRLYSINVKYRYLEFPIFLSLVPFGFPLFCAITLSFGDSLSAQKCETIPSAHLFKFAMYGYNNSFRLKMLKLLQKLNHKNFQPLFLSRIFLIIILNFRDSVRRFLFRHFFYQNIPPGPPMNRKNGFTNFFCFREDIREKTCFRVVID